MRRFETGSGVEREPVLQKQIGDIDAENPGSLNPFKTSVLVDVNEKSERI